jgi:phage/plasmid-like protein (TIGR03299 family)
MNTFADDLLAGIFNDVQNPENAWNVQEILEKFKLDWKVEKQPLLLPDGSETPFFGIVRTDNSTCFTTCKEGFTAYQNSELAELLIRMSEKTGYNIYNGGMFNGGGKVYIQLESPNKITDIGTNRDTVNGYITGINGHDGTTSLKWGETNITISCKNTFMAARRELKSTARHTASIHNQVEVALRELTQVVKEEQSLFDTFIKLADIPVKPEAIAQIIKQITDVDVTKKASELKDTVSSYKINQSQDLIKSISKEMVQKGATMWGLMSGVTQYTSHVMSVPKRENARLESLYTGGGFKTNNEAFATVRELAHV